MNSKDYWAQREAEALKHRITDEKEYDREIKRIYSEMLDNIQKEIDGFYGRYSSKEGISLAEAKKRVSQADIAAYERKAKKYVKEKDFSDKANEEMRLYNLMMKVNRLELLKANIGLETIAGHNELEKFLGSVLKGRTMDELKRQAGILGKSVGNNEKAAHAIVNGSFKNGTFSDRIWQYQDLMRIDLGKELQTALVQGKNPRAIGKTLRGYWYGNDPKTGGGAVYCMERLMRTELARVQTEAQKQSFERNGFDMFMFIANSGCCPDCNRLNGKTFRVSKMMPGENASPLHPNCRCSVAAHEDSAEYEAWLDYLSKGGKTEDWKSHKIRMATNGSVIWPERTAKISNEDYKKVMQYARERNIELSGFKHYDGDTQTLMDLINDADSVAKNYPKIKEGKRKFTISLDDTLSGDDFAVTNGHIVSINAKAYRNTKKLSEEYSKAVEDGWFVRGTDYHAIIKHEIGHVVANAYGHDCIQVASKCTGIKKNTKLMEYIEENLSLYAISRSDGSEIISECFASVYGSEKPSDFALKFVEEYVNM